MKKGQSPSGDPVELCDGRRGDGGAARRRPRCSSSGSPASRTRRPNATTSTSRRASAASTRGRTSASRAFRSARSQKISLLPNRPEFVWVRIEVDEQTPVLQGTSAQIHGVGFTGVSEIQLTGAERGRPPIEQLGPQGCPVVPGDLGRHQRAAQQRAGADRPHPAPDRAADRAAERQEPEFDLRHPREYRRDDAGAAQARAGDGQTRSPRSRSPSHNAGHRREQCRGAVRQHQSAGDRGRQARRSRTSTRRSSRSSRRPTTSNAMISDARPGVQNFSKSTLPEANKLVHDLRDLSKSLQRCPTASISRASAARSGPKSCPTTSQGNANEAAYEDRKRGGPVARAHAAARACWAAGGKPPATLVTLTPEAAEPAQIARSAGAGQAVTIATPSVSSRARHGARAGPAHADATSNMSPTCSCVDTPAKLFADLARGDGAPHHQPRRARSRPDQRSTRA